VHAPSQAPDSAQKWRAPFVLTSIASSLQNCTRVGFRQSIHRHHTDHQGWM
jgi:hypothetical protein